jgi:hypothetical protein
MASFYSDEEKNFTAKDVLRSEALRRNKKGGWVAAF